jgi:hypothetical protein
MPLWVREGGRIQKAIRSQNAELRKFVQDSAIATPANFSRPQLRLLAREINDPTHISNIWRQQRRDLAELVRQARNEDLLSIHHETTGQIFQAPRRGVSITALSQPVATPNLIYFQHRMVAARSESGWPVNLSDVRKSIPLLPGPMQERLHEFIHLMTEHGPQKSVFEEALFKNYKLTNRSMKGPHRNWHCHLGLCDGTTYVVYWDDLRKANGIRLTFTGTHEAANKLRLGH